MCRWICVFWSKDEESYTGHAKEEFCTNHCALQNCHSRGECSKPGHFLNKQHEFCARERCQVDSSGDWTLLFIHRTGTAQTAALRASPQCLVNVSQSCSGGAPSWGEKAVQSLHVLSILGLTARGGWAGCQLMPTAMGTRRVWAGTWEIFHIRNGPPAVFLLAVT